RSSPTLGSTRRWRPPNSSAGRSSWPRSRLPKRLVDAFRFGSLQSPQTTLGSAPLGDANRGAWRIAPVSSRRRPAALHPPGGGLSLGPSWYRHGPRRRGYYQRAVVKRVLLAAPRGFCAGVERAIETVERALELYGPPVYVRRQIVHNVHVVRDL